MMLDRRVTLRCLVEDLTADWDDVDQYRSVKKLRSLIGKRLADEIQDSTVAHQLRGMPRLNIVAHPLVRHFDASFGTDEDPSSRESISGLTTPHWWKQKTIQWRGAATDHSMIGSNAVWLCAAGIRRQGNNDDFYTSFMRDVGRLGAEPWLPAPEDRLAVTIDEKILALDAWKLQLHCGSLALLAESLARPGETETMRFPAPVRGDNSDAIGELSLSAESVDVEGVELIEVFLTARILDRVHTKSVDIAAQIARAALQDEAEEWHSTTFTDDAYAFSAVIAPAARAQADELIRTGTLPAGCAPGSLRIGLRAHYSRKHGLVDAQVDGSSVLALCGYWFVPTADHANLDTCTECAYRHGQMDL